MAFLVKKTAFNHLNYLWRQLLRFSIKLRTCRLGLSLPTFCVPATNHRGAPLLYWSQTSETCPLFSAPSPAMAACPPWIGSRLPMTSDPLPLTSFCLENPIVSAPVVSRVKLSEQFR